MKNHGKNRKDVADARKKIESLRNTVRLAFNGPSFPDLVNQSRLRKEILETRTRGKVAEEKEKQLKDLIRKSTRDKKTALKTVQELDRNSRILICRGSARRLARELGTRTLGVVPALTPSQRNPAIGGYIPAHPGFWPPPPPEERRWNLAFQGTEIIQSPHDQIPNAESYVIVPGAAGLSGLPRIDNDDTDEGWNTFISVSWIGEVPRDGVFCLNWSPFVGSAVLTNLKWKSTGSGLWGDDARIMVDYLSWICVGNDSLYAHAERLVDETKVMAGSAEGTVSRELPVGGPVMFWAKKGEIIEVEFELEVCTWSDDGRAQVWIDAFYIPYIADDPDHVLTLSD